MKHGVSLLELLIGVALFGVISILFVTVVLTNSRLFSDQKANIHLASQNRIALDEITNQVRESQAFIADCSGQPVNCPGGSNSLQLVLATWPLDISGSPNQDDEICGFDYIVYKRGTDPTQLVKQIFPDSSSSRSQSEKIIASNVINLLFSYDQADPYSSTEVTISLENEESTVHKTHSLSQSTKATLRNKGQAAGGETISFKYALQATGSTKNVSFEDNVKITGDIYANQKFKDSNCQLSSGDCQVFGNAFWSTADSFPGAVRLTGSKNPETTPPKTLPDINLTYWQEQANINNDPYIGNYNINLTADITLGPKYIDGDLKIEHEEGENFNEATDTWHTVTIAGPIYVTGSITIKNGVILKLDDSFGSNGTVIIAQGKIKIIGNEGSAQVQVKSTNSTPEGYLLFVSISDDPTGPAIDLQPKKNKNINAIFLATKKGIDVRQDGTYSEFEINLTDHIVALAALGEIQIETLVEYDTNILNANFSPEPPPPGTSSCAP